MLKRLLSAFLKTLLVFAVIHVAMLVYLALSTSNLTFLNLFSILDLHLFFPGIEMGATSNILSAVIMTLIFIFFYKFRTKKEEKEEKKNSNSSS